MKDEVEIVKELPPHLESLDMEAIGSQVCNLCYFLVYVSLRIIFSYSESIILTTILPF